MQEIQACWYDNFEYREIQEEAKFVVSLYKNPKLVVDDAKYPRRGLETFLDPVCDQVELSIIAVLNEQASTLQKKGSKSPMDVRIESAYTVFTQGSRIQARLNAQADELDARPRQQDRAPTKPKRVESLVSSGG